MDQLRQQRPVQPTRLLSASDMVSRRSQSRSADQSNGSFQLSFFLPKTTALGAKLMLVKRPSVSLT